MRILLGMLNRAGTLALVLLAGSAGACKATTTKSPIYTTTGNGVGNGNENFAAKLDPSCMTNSYDACIFLQNPVAQKGAPFSAPVTRSTDLSSYQTYAVQITGLDNSGFLQNASYLVTPSAVQAVKRDASGRWKYPYSSCSSPGNCVQDANHKVSQLMAYYWLNFQVTTMTSRAGSFFAANHAIPVDPFFPGLQNAYWDSTTKAIVLGEDNSQDFAISAEVYLHENGHANVYYGSLGNIEAPSALEVNCSGNACCTTNKGCPSAINEGLADFHAGVIFPADTALGETIVNSMGGFRECNLPRNIASNSSLTAAQAYTACPVAVRGEIHVMGRVYASVWWEVRKAAADPNEIDTLFTEHLRIIAATDNFETIAGKINTLDTTLFAGKHVAAFNAQWSSRGLTPQ